MPRAGYRSYQYRSDEAPGSIAAQHISCAPRLDPFLTRASSTGLAGLADLDLATLHSMRVTVNRLAYDTTFDAAEALARMRATR